LAELGGTHVRVKEKSGPLLAALAWTELDVTTSGSPRRLMPVIFPPLIVATMSVLAPNDPAQ
jgi:hypothetical protein